MLRSIGQYLVEILVNLLQDACGENWVCLFLYIYTTKTYLHTVTFASALGMRCLLARDVKVTRLNEICQGKNIHKLTKEVMASHTSDTSKLVDVDNSVHSDDDQMFVDFEFVKETQLEDLGTNNIEDLEVSNVNQPIHQFRHLKISPRVGV